MPPFLAQGAAMAIEDAAVLAASLAATPDDPASALATYQAARRPRAKRVSDAAFQTGAHYHFGTPMAALRNTALQVAGWRLAVMRNDWIYGWKPDA
jgi:salicylate hydroxylase